MIDLTILKAPEKSTTNLEFYNGDEWVSLTKQAGRFLEVKLLKDRLRGLSAMNNFPGIDETPPALEKSFKATTKLSRELLTKI